MARSTRSSTLETRTSRLKLSISKKPVFVKIAPGVGLGYRRNQTAGTWVARVADGVLSAELDQTFEILGTSADDGHVVPLLEEQFRQRHR